MTLDAKEKSRHKGRPCNLFLVRYGESANSYFAYTDAEQDVTVDTIVYRSVAFSRGAIVVKGNMDKAAMEVRCSLKLPLADLFVAYPPSQIVTLTIFQGHLNDPDAQFLTIWAGRILSAKRETDELIMTCEPIRTAMKRLGLRRHYGYGCSHKLYGPHCNANKTAASYPAIVSSVSGHRITLVGGWTDRPVSDFVGGMVEWNNLAGDKEIRGVVRVVGDTLTLAWAPRDIQTGTEVTVIRGCSRDEAGCNSHNNIHNFGGCPFIPTKNPISRTNRFY